MDKVLISDLRVRGIIGIHSWERERPQDIIINIVLFTDLRKAGDTDNIENCINYQTIAEKVCSHAENAKRLTVEALAADIADLCVRVDGVERVRARVEKPDAIKFARAVGVEIERSRQDRE